MADYSAMSDADLMALVQPKASSDYSKMSDGELMKIVGKSSAGDVASDVAKSAGIGVVKGPIQFAGTPGDIQSLASSDYNPLNYLTKKFEQSYRERAASNRKNAERAGLGEGVTGATRLPTSQDIQSKVEGVTGEFYKPQSRPGRFAESATSFASNPLSYVGPGTAAVKAGLAVTGGLGSEAGGQLAEGTPYETVARIGGGVAGALAGAKTFGPAIEKAAVPIIDELKVAADKGYDTARKSGLELHPQGVSNFASKVEQDLIGPDHGFTGGKFGTAPKTLNAVTELRELPNTIAAATKANPGSTGTFTAANLDTVRKNLGRIARETNEGKPTADAAAASIALEHLKDYTEAIPKNHILAGDAQVYAAAIKQANADYAAMSRSRTIDTKLTRAENNAAGGIHTSPDNQIKSQLRQILNNPKAQRGFSQEELDAMHGVNKGTVTSNSLRQVGRLGAGVVPAIAHTLTAVSTGGASIIPQIAAAVPLYGARKIAEALTRGHANRLDEMVRMRSPEYQARSAALPPSQPPVSRAAIVRALLAGQH